MTQSDRLGLSFSNLKIRSKLLVVLVAIAVSSAGAFGVIQYKEAREALEAESFNKLTAARELKAQQVEDYFAAISSQVAVFAGSPTAVEAMKAFRVGFDSLDAGVVTDVDPRLAAYYRDEFFARLGPNTIGALYGVGADRFIPTSPKARLLQQRYISDNPNPTGEKHRLDDARDRSAYSATHKLYHPVIRSFIEKFGYYDVFLIDAVTGVILYSVFKEVDYATSLLTGPYAETNLATAFRAARDADVPGFVRMEDFKPYYPSYGAPAAFIGSPIFDGGEKIGVVVFQMPIDRINDIMTSHQRWKDVGLGESGETYIVGDDLLMRNQSRFLIEDRANYLALIRSLGVDQDTVRRIDQFNSSIGLQPVDTKGVRAALSGAANTEIFPDYRGVSVLSAYRPLAVPDVRWVIMSEIDAAEAFARVEALKRRMLALMGVFIAAIIAISVVFSRKMTRRIQVLTDKAHLLAEGELGIPIDTRGGDEISQLARSFDAMREALRELIEGLEAKVAQRTQALQESEARIRTIFENAADGIIVIDSRGVVLNFSPSAQRIFGFTAEEMIGAKVERLMGEPMRSQHDGYLKRYFETGERRVVGRNREVYGLRKDGTEFPLELAVGEAMLGEERIFVGIIRDITKRKQAEQTINQGYQIINQAPMNVSVRDVEGRFTFVNASYESFHGVKLEELVGKTASECFPDDFERIAEHDAEVLERGGKVESEKEVRSVDGSELVFQQVKFAISDLNGRNVAVAGFDVDITERKKLERALSIANKRMGDELSIGRQIQMSMIPLTFPRFPEHKDLDVWAHIRPAREVGGDFYDFFFIGDRYFAFVIADVSGKGVPAALLMAVTKTLLKARAQDTQSSARIIEATNKELSQNNDECMFITAFFGIIDIATGTLTYTNAGHNPPYLIRTDGTVQSLRELHGPMIGVMEGTAYEETEVRLRVDDKLLLYTDGVTEAFDSAKELYGEARLASFVEHSSALGTRYLVESLVEDVDAFAGGEEQSDDITVFCLRYVAWDVRDERATMQLQLVNDLSEITRCLQSLDEICDRFELSQEIRNSFSIVLDDLLNNIINYAFADSEKHVIEVVLSTDRQRFIASVTDDGVEFDPFLRKEPDTDSGIEEREVGGLGIHLIRNLMDDYSYRRVKGKNVTTLMKRMSKETRSG